MVERARRVVLRRKSFPVACWGLTVVFVSMAVGASSALGSRVTGGPLVGIAGCLGTIALTHRILGSRILLHENYLVVVNPIMSHIIPYGEIRGVDGGNSGTLTIHIGSDGEIFSTAFGGSLLDHFVGSTEKAISCINSKRRRMVRSDGVQLEHGLRFSFVADVSLMGAVGCVVLAMIVGL